jgi:hypothetical protein
VSAALCRMKKSGNFVLAKWFGAFYGGVRALTAVESVPERRTVDPPRV